MRASFIAIIFFSLALLSFNASQALSSQVALLQAVNKPLPKVPETGGESLVIEDEEVLTLFEQLLEEPNPSQYPKRLTIPGIKLDAPIDYMGLNDKGEMDVPSGKTKDVGWYEHGTIPGKKGSAVVAAHVYAAFSKLRYVMPGQDIYVETVGGEVLHFVVTDSMLYPLADVPREFLFNRNDGERRLNLITCAGKFDKKLGTYDKRLIVYAKLVK